MNLHNCTRTKDPHVVTVGRVTSSCSCGFVGGYLQHFIETHPGQEPFWCEARTEDPLGCQTLVTKRHTYCEKHER